MNGNIIIKLLEELQMSEVPLISTEKQAELLQRSDISKISLRNGEKAGQHTPPRRSHTAIPSS